MAFQVSPGVVTSEIDLTSSIPQTASSVGASIGNFSWGPVNQIVSISTEDELKVKFGKPNDNNYKSFLSCANFLSYGNDLKVVRIANSSIKNSTGTLEANNSVVSINNEIEFEDNYGTYANTKIGVLARYPGELGNSIRFSMCPSSAAYEQTIDGLTGNTTATDFTLSNADDFLIQGSLIIFDGETRSVTQVNSSAFTVNAAFSTALSSSSVTAKWAYADEFDDAPGTSTYASNAGGSDDEVHIIIIDNDGKLTGTKGQILEKYSYLSKAKDAKDEQGLINYFPEVLKNKSSWVYIAGTFDPNESELLGSESTNAFVPTTEFSKPYNFLLSGGISGETVTDGEKQSGLDYFANTEEVDVNLLFVGDASPTVAAYAIQNIAEVRKDCIAFVSPEQSDVVNTSAQTTNVIAFRNSLPSSSYGVLDSGYKYQYDKYNDTFRYVPLNADIAGLCARTDAERDPFFSPAGFTRGQIKNVGRLAYNPKKSDRDSLYKKGVNPVVSFPGEGTILFGDKTLLSKPSAFDRINVRRLFIVLEKTISTAAKFSLFEFNDEFTRSQFVSLVEPFLRDIQGRGGIQDFLVVCDSSNNTADVIDRNEFRGDIFIKPARSINFIQLNFVAVASGVEFSEIIGA